MFFKRLGKVGTLAVVLLVVFPAIYLIHLWLEPKPGNGDDLVPQTNLHCVMTEQRMDGDSLIVTVRNTGGDDWTEKDWIRGGIFNEGEDTGIRAHMKPGTRVSVGDTVTFTFPDIRASLPLQPQFGMLQETIDYFPERYPIVVR